MKLVALSDTHNLNEKIMVPPGDMFIHAGDLTNFGTLSEVTKALDWIASQPHPYKVLVAGNHDFMAMKSQADFVNLCQQRNIDYLCNRGIEIEGVTFWGSPCLPHFGDWAFMHTEEELAEIFSSIPQNTHVLITHSPPKGILDKVSRPFETENVGSISLKERVLQIKPKVHVFGHVHEWGSSMEAFGETTFVNACALDTLGRPWDRKPVELEL